MLLKLVGLIDVIVLTMTVCPAIVFSLGLFTCNSISDIPRYIRDETELSIYAAVFYVFLVINFFAYVTLSRG